MSGCLMTSQGTAAGSKTSALVPPQKAQGRPPPARLLLWPHFVLPVSWDGD